MEATDTRRAKRPDVPVRRVAAVLAVAGFAVVLWGGYVRRWSWTGLSHNDSLWDWLNLLLLPLAVATLPIWLRAGDRVHPRRRRLTAAAMTAFAGLVAAGYLVPMVWTGFTGNHLWDWLTLLVLPVVLAVTAFWRETERDLRARHHLLLTAGLAAFALTVVGGYVWHWAWTGFEGNTLWDWTKLLIAPLVVPTVLLPATAAWLTTAADEEAQQRAQPLQARFALAALAVLSAGGVIAVLALADHPAARGAAGPPGTARRTGAAAAATACRRPSGAAVAVDGATRVIRDGSSFYACLAGGRAVALGAARAPGGPRQFHAAAGRVVFADDRCTAARTCISRINVLRLGAATRPFVRLAIPASGGTTGLYVGPRGTLAVMLRGGCAPGHACAPARLYVEDAGGRRLVATGPRLDPTSLAGSGAVVYWRDGGRAASTALHH